MKTILLALVSVLATTTVSANQIRHAAKELVVNLNDYQHTISIKHANTIQQNLTEAVQLPNFIDTVCQENHDCLSGAFSFTNESSGLINSLELEKYYIKTCDADPACIYATDNYIHDMVNANLGQVHYVLQKYLLENA